MAHNPGYQIDTYRMNDDNPDLNHQAFGSTYQDYQDGYFWSRSFEHAGADPNNFCGGFPVLMAESRDLSIECLDSTEMQAEYYFVLIDKLPCDHCPPYVTRNGWTVSDAVLKMLRAFLDELYSYKYYEVDRGGTITFEWMSEGRADYEIDQGSTLLYNGELMPDISPERVNITEWGNFTNMRAYMARVVFNLCEPTGLTFDYATPVVPGLATNECEGC
jgi:hypothetical protein